MTREKIANVLLVILVIWGAAAAGLEGRWLSFGFWIVAAVTFAVIRWPGRR